ncbi:MAG: hypothetical protein BMS9Abin05_2608 [Rhodothermia bacterium]|nr:MAG: hypothetical protein BMS9Abin05_2608 [Rhodothermia bacterium]
MDTRRTLTTLILVSFLSTSAWAQSGELSLGPQINGFGIGASVSYSLTDLLSLSAEFGFLPISDVSLTVEDIEYTISPDISGGIIGINLHPFKGNFSVGVGVVLGKYSSEAETGQLSDAVEIGDTDFDAASVGSLEGDFAMEGAWPAVMIGWRGSGFNFGLGIAFNDRPDIEVISTGSINNNPFFQGELEKEIRRIREKFDAIGLIRIGYQFGIGSK